jgi:hypothetical protein
MESLGRQTRAFSSTTEERGQEEELNLEESPAIRQPPGLGGRLQDRSGLESSIQTTLPQGTSSLDSIFCATLNVQENIHAINYNIEFNHKSLVKLLKNSHESLRNSIETALRLSLQKKRVPIKESNDERDNKSDAIITMVNDNYKEIMAVKERVNKIEAVTLSSSDNVISAIK